MTGLLSGCSSAEREEIRISEEGTVEKSEVCAAVHLTVLPLGRSHQNLVAFKVKGLCNQTRAHPSEDCRPCGGCGLLPYNLSPGADRFFPLVTAHNMYNGGTGCWVTGKQAQHHDPFMSNHRTGSAAGAAAPRKYSMRHMIVNSVLQGGTFHWNTVQPSISRYFQSYFFCGTRIWWRSFLSQFLFECS